ncbi:hypothetical protein BGX26_000412, partial [Mortierella sp. AD094]
CVEYKMHSWSNPKPTRTEALPQSDDPKLSSVDSFACPVNVITTDPLQEERRHDSIQQSPAGQGMEVGMDYEADSDIELLSASCESLDLGAQDTATPPNHQQHNNLEPSSPVVKGPGFVGLGVASKKTKLRNGVPMNIQREVIDTIKQAPQMSLKDVGLKFGLPRTTVAGIKSREDVILRSQCKDGFRVTKGRLYKVESIVANWAWRLNSRGISVSNRKISAQALEVHRLLSDALIERLPPCKYTDSWMKGFKGRYGTFLKKQRTHPTRRVWESWLQVSKALNLSEYQPEDVYFLDVASLFLDVVPRSDVGEEFVHGGLPHQIDPVDHPNDPIRLMVEQQYLTLNAMVRCESILLVNQAMWGYLENVIPALQLQLLKVVLVPDGISSVLPMTASLKSEFKAAYHTLILENSRKAEAIQLFHSIFITDSWTQDHHHVIQESFERFWATAVRPTSNQFRECSSQSEKHANGRLQDMISQLFPDKERKKYEHYLVHDGDTGPSDSIYNLIHMAVNQELEAEDLSLGFDPDPPRIWANFLTTLPFRLIPTTCI